eukprot:CAMPEP_0195031348 /NCGR_PEP_ID=MMETSP0326_2-20130528/61009_1 /TAXON_ID=2866 ORGANISM="Crypthecodinium cohnii, Strain Seligo" /NCGR_SAMPLE_ID=MMETSP0326_2 /ASSEMBLY_ACC=CAM_ASM_000348 /LENGTH=31 /DNA_ID= /DNA_START= /DNA_END= /DNA_ORIENTATION=
MKAMFIKSISRQHPLIPSAAAAAAAAALASS